jgi:hypothetical protein
MVVVLLVPEWLPVSGSGSAAVVGIPVDPERAEIAEWRKAQTMQAFLCDLR